MASSAFDWRNPALAAIIHPDYFVTLNSYRMDRFLDDGSLAHLALARLAQPIQDCRDAMFDLSDNQRSDWFEAAGGHRFFNRDGEELWIKDEYYFDPPLTLFDDDLAITFRARQTTKRIAIPVDAAAFRILGPILSRLSAYVGLPDLHARLDESDCAFLEYLESEGLVAVVPVAMPLERHSHSVTLVGHSCLLVQSPHSRVLVDPLLVVRHRPRLNLTGVLQEPLDAIVISHPHWDHFNVDTLLLVDRDTPVVVPRLRSRPSIVNIDMVHLLREMGFNRIVDAEPWQTMHFGDIAFTSLPFHGEGSGKEGHQDWQTYLLQTGERSILGLVDACADAFGSMDDVVVKVRKQVGPVDLLFSPCADFQFQISQYQRRPFALSRCLEQFTGSAADTLRWASLSDAQAIIPYAEFIYEECDVDSPPGTSAQKGSQRDLFRLASPELEPRITVVTPGRSIEWFGSPGWLPSLA